MADHMDAYWIAAIRSALSTAFSEHWCSGDTKCGVCIVEREMHEAAKKAGAVLMKDPSLLNAPMEKRDLAREGTPESPAFDSQRGTTLYPTHRCKVCGAFWRLNPALDPKQTGLPADYPLHSDTWSLFPGQKCGSCCDNAPMGEQIEALPCPQVEPCSAHPRPSTIISEGDAQQGGMA